MIIKCIPKYNIYFKFEILAGMALCHGAGSFPVLCPSVYKFICGTIDEVSDLDERTLLQQVHVSEIILFTCKF